MNGTRALVTGGAGFIGTNLVSRLVDDGHAVTVLDDLSRPGVELNLAFLQRTYGRRVRFLRGDVRDRHVVRRAVAGCDRVFHLAAQVAVTTSLDDPVADFETNLGGTLTLLEELRRLDEPPFVLFTSTNKVYGSLADVELRRETARWQPADPVLRTRGVSERRPLDFCTPYGCSKGAADQYVLDYAHSYALPAVVFRMSCIYGPHQHGTEDQGWVAHFALRLLQGEPVTVYGDGAQVRDILFVDDLVEAMLIAHDHAGSLAGHAFNIGGGAENAVSLLEVLDLLGGLSGSSPRLCTAEERPGDQRWYVSDVGRFGRATGWRPQTPVVDGVERLHRHLVEERMPIPARTVAR
jgi:CDP-paratose 2-epimerase